MNKKFQDGLRDIANEIPPADMHARALAESHRIGARRTVVAVGAAVFGVIALAGTTFAVLPNSDDAAPPAVEDPTPSRDSIPDQDPDHDSAPADDFPGTVYYFFQNADTGHEDQDIVTVYQHSDGEVDLTNEFTSRAGTPGIGVSSDGRYLGYEEGTSYVVLDRDTGEPVPLPRDMAGGASDGLQSEGLYGCGVAWSPTRNEVAYSIVPDADITALRLVISNVDTGETVISTRSDACDYRWSADGRFLVYLDTDDNGAHRVNLLDPTSATVTAQFNLEQDSPQNLSLVHVSANAEYICVAEHAPADPDVVGATACDLAYDTATGSAVTFDVDGREADLVGFTEEGRLVMVTADGPDDQTLWLTEPDGTILAEAAMPQLGPQVPDLVIFRG